VAAVKAMLRQFFAVRATDDSAHGGGQLRRVLGLRSASARRSAAAFLL
jgi:hypothetical protein